MAWAFAIGLSALLATVGLATALGREACTAGGDAAANSGAVPDGHLWDAPKRWEPTSARHDVAAEWGWRDDDLFWHLSDSS